MIAMLLAALVAAPPTSNVEPPSLGASPHVLTDFAAGPVGGPRFLYIPAAEDDLNFRLEMEVITGGTMDYFDARVDTPDLGFLEIYDGIYTWNEEGYADGPGISDKFRNYIDTGRCFIFGYGCLLPGGLSGTIVTAAYCPVNNPTATNDIGLYTPANETQSCIWTAYPMAPLMINRVERLVLNSGAIQDGELVKTTGPAQIAAAYYSLTALPRTIYLNGAHPSVANQDIPCWVANALACHGVELECPEDLDADGSVGFSDLLFVLSAWEQDVPEADLDGDGVVGLGDLLQVLSNWGACG